MVKSYTPQERAERRRRSSQKSTNRPLVEDVGEDEAQSAAGEASWIADLRAQGVDVEEFLQSAIPPEVVDIADAQSQGDLSGEGSRRGSRRMSRLSMLSNVSSDHPPDGNNNDANGGRSKRFTQFLDKAYVFDESVGDMVIHSFEDMSEKMWQREVREDSRNYAPDPADRERIEQNKQWALKMARQRAREAGYEQPAPSDDSANGNSSEDGKIYPKVDPPPTRPLPPIEEKDLEISEPPLNPGELGIAPPPLPHRLVDLVPRVARSKVEGIVDGIVVDGTCEEGLEACDSETMVVRCINTDCVYYLHCSRGSSLVRCENCKTVSPACPFSAGCSRRHDSTSMESGVLTDGAVRLSSSFRSM
mmetsp:Transcript_23309/g.49856  ORF Transcript_23309/g.49856 Transcript_23309/m.49856 type:complete len:361 (-) Transcript_23309:399-1481(-)